MGMLDKSVDVLGEEKVTILNIAGDSGSGFPAGTVVGIILPTADQVMVGDVKRTRLGIGKGSCFLVGVNEGVIPQRAVRAAGS